MIRRLVGTTSSASATVAPSVSGSLRILPCGASRRDSRYTTSAPSSACGQLSGMSAKSPPPTVGVLATQEDLPLTAVTLLHPVHQPAAIVGRGQDVLRDELVGHAIRKVQPVGCFAEVAEPHLLLEPGGIGNEGVPEPGPVLAPSHRPAHEVDVWDGFVDDLATRDVEDVQRPVLGPVLRQRDRETVPIRRRDEPVDRGLTRRVDGFRIHHDALGAGVLQAGEGHQERPLPRRLLLQREVGAPARGQARVRRAFGPKQLLDARPQRIAPRQRLEVSAGQVLLRLCPGDGLRRGRVFQPLVVLGDVDPVVPGGDRDPRRLHGGKVCHRASQQLRHVPHNEPAVRRPSRWAPVSDDGSALLTWPSRPSARQQTGVTSPPAGHTHLPTRVRPMLSRMDL